MPKNKEDAVKNWEKYAQRIAGGGKRVGGSPIGILLSGARVRLKSGTEGWVRGEIVDYYDVIPTVGGVMFGGGMTPGYKVYIEEGKHKGETIRVPLNYVEAI